MPISTGRPSGSGAAAEVDDGKPPVGHEHEIARMGIAVHHPHSGGASKVSSKSLVPQRSRSLAGAVPDDLRHRDAALDPLADHDLGALPTMCGTRSAVAIVGLGERR